MDGESHPMVWERRKKEENHTKGVGKDKKEDRIEKIKREEEMK